MRALAAAAALLLASCFDPQGRCAADAECLAGQICGPDALCVPGTRPPPGDPPVAQVDAYTFAGAGPFVVAAGEGVLANDSVPGGGSLSAVVVSGPGYGQVFLAPDGGFTYVPVVGPGGPFTGADAFSYRAESGVLTSAETVVSLTVTP